MKMPSLGQRVRLRPTRLPGSARLRRVQDGAGGFGRFLPDDGAERTVDDWWHRRLADGSVELVEAEKPALPAPSLSPSRPPVALAPIPPRAEKE